MLVISHMGTIKISICTPTRLAAMSNQRPRPRGMQQSSTGAFMQFAPLRLGGLRARYPMPDISRLGSYVPRTRQSRWWLLNFGSRAM